jgi:hypothetical protein
MRYPDALPGMLPEGYPSRRDAKEALDMARSALKRVAHTLPADETATQDTENTLGVENGN